MVRAHHVCMIWQLTNYLFHLVSLWLAGSCLRPVSQKVVAFYTIYDGEQLDVGLFNGCYVAPTSIAHLEKTVLLSDYK